MKFTFHITTVRRGDRSVTVYKDGTRMPLRGGRFAGLEEARAYIRYTRAALNRKFYKEGRS